MEPISTSRVGASRNYASRAHLGLDEDRGGHRASQQAVGSESVLSALERLTKADDYLGVLVERASGIRSQLAIPPPTTAGADKPSAPAAGVVGAVHVVADSISGRLSALDSLLSDIQRAIGL